MQAGTYSCPFTTTRSPTASIPERTMGQAFTTSTLHRRNSLDSLQQELLEELGTRDLGIERADLAVVRPSWMPSILSEALFMMIPEQEAALRDPDVQRRIALAHVRALEAFAARRSGFPAR